MPLNFSNTRRAALLQGAAAAGALCLPALSARAATKVAFGYSAVSDFATVFIATDEGMFAKRGLEVELKFIPITSTIPAAIQSGSLQMGGPTPTGYLQAVQGGLDHVVLGGGGVLSKTYTELGLVARAGAGIKTPQDCAGKKIGVPGIGALLHVAFSQWLKVNGVSAQSVTFIESPFPQHADMVKGGTVDAVVTGGPFMTRIIDSGAGYVASYFTTFLPEGYPTVIHVARRDWVAANPAAVKAFREGLQEATAFLLQSKNDARVRELLGKYLKLAPPAVAKMQISPPGPVVTAKQLQWWGTLLRDQGLVTSNMNYADLVLKA
ncbi:ABC transporter substrate-binding protein [Ideonella sp. DXS29W]|uniref:ABC transporter substrate-binding protein n=1 Tax=Ideonella lacteola TaxID=2984193 RepID=A0ABU9BIA8_9BURK